MEVLMRALMRVLQEQRDYEDYLRVETSQKICCSDKLGRKFYRWVKARRRALKRFCKKYSSLCEYELARYT